MRLVSWVLNLPWTIIGLVVAFVSIPWRINFKQNAFIFDTGKFWWMVVFPWMKGARAMTIGNVIILGPTVLPLDLEHEQVHVRQYQQYPLIFLLLYYYELFRNGYRNNKFEDEAYRVAGNQYIGEN